MSDKAVSKKIAKLVGEGKPQAQAVAIALSMKKAGKLDSGKSKEEVMGKHAAKKLARLTLVNKGKPMGAK